MSVKLSELLEAGAEALAIDSDNFSERETNRYARLYSAQATALRAIAPALVEYVAADHACGELGGDDEWASVDIDALDAVNQRLANASTALRDAMKAAGVTCE